MNQQNQPGALTSTDLVGILRFCISPDEFVPRRYLSHTFKKKRDYTVLSYLTRCCILMVK